MPSGKKLTAQQIIEIIQTYEKVKNVWKVGEQLGIPGQTVHAHLRKLGLINHPKYTEEEIEEIKKEYAKPVEEFSLDELAARLSRHVSGICKFAKALGLTTREHSNYRSSARLKKINVPNRWAGGNHPKGMAGKKHSEETKKKLGQKSKEASQNRSEEQKAAISAKAIKTKIARYGTPAPGFTNSINVYSRTKKGKREDLGEIFFRSSWEANYARYLNYLIKTGEIKSWEFEPDTFQFEKEVRGVKSYLPDFKVWKLDNTFEYHEVKGWMDAKSKAKLKKFAKYYPLISLKLIDSKEYKKLEKQFKSILAHWE